jgi:hypothetical protein
MPLIGLKEAARLTGKNQSTIHRAMKASRLSYTMSETGERLIDPAELDRVFAVKPPEQLARNEAQASQSNDVQLAELRMQLAAERDKAAGLHERLAEKDAVIVDLREDRDHWRTQAETLLLTDERRKEVAAHRRRPWWRWRRQANELGS